MGTFIRDGGAWKTVTPFLRDGAAWTSDLASWYIRNSGWTQFHPDGGTLEPPENLAVGSIGDHEATLSWTNPTQTVTPTHQQVRIPEITSVWTEFDYPNTSRVRSALTEATDYQFQIRNIVRVDGLVTDTSPTVSVFFTTLALDGPGAPAADPGGTGSDTIIPWSAPTGGTGGTVGGSDCWWEYEWQQFDSTLATYPTVWIDTGITGSVDGDIGDWSFDPIADGLICGDPVRLKYNENCNGTPAADQFGEMMTVPCDWTADCAGLADNGDLGIAPYVDAAFAMPVFCYDVDDNFIIEDARGASNYGKLAGFGAVSVTGQSVYGKAGITIDSEGIVGGRNTAVAAIAEGSDLAFSGASRIYDKPSIKSKLLVVGQTVEVYAYPTGSSPDVFKIAATWPTEGGGSVTLTDDTDRSLGTWVRWAVNIDQDGTKELWVDGAQVDTDVVGDAVDMGSWNGDVICYGNEFLALTQMAGWDRVLTESELGIASSPSEGMAEPEVAQAGDSRYDSFNAVGIAFDSSTLVAGAQKSNVTAVNGRDYHLSQSQSLRYSEGIVGVYASIGNTLTFANFVDLDPDTPFSILNENDGGADTTLVLPASATTGVNQRHLIMVATFQFCTIGLPAGYTALDGFTTGSYVHMAISDRGDYPDPAATPAISETISASTHWKVWGTVLNGYVRPRSGAYLRVLDKDASSIRPFGTREDDIILALGSDTDYADFGLADQGSEGGQRWWKPTWADETLDEGVASTGVVDTFGRTGSTTETMILMILGGATKDDIHWTDLDTSTISSDLHTFPALVNDSGQDALIIRALYHDNRNEFKLNYAGLDADQRKLMYSIKGAFNIGGTGDNWLIQAEWVAAGASTTEVVFDNSDTANSITQTQIRSIAVHARPSAATTLNRLIYRDQLPTYHNSGGNQTSYSGVAITGLTAAEDVCYCLWTADSPSAALTTPSGWTVISSTVTADGQTVLMYQVPTGTTISAPTFATAVSCKSDYIFQTYRGLDQSSPHGTAVVEDNGDPGVSPLFATSLVTGPHLLGLGAVGGAVSIGQQSKILGVNAASQTSSLSDGTRSNLALNVPTDYKVNTNASVTYPSACNNNNLVLIHLPLNPKTKTLA